MKIMTVLGTRPEIIRLSLLIPLLDDAVEHVVVHTGQNFDDRLDGLFFRELGVRKPDINLAVRGDTFGEQVGAILAGVEPLLRSHRPDRLLILGDTNSGVSAIVARRLGIPVYHMEAGNRCYDDRVPEEVNRRVIDHASTVLLPYTNRSRENLIAEGIAANRVYVTGNPIFQIVEHSRDKIAASTVLERESLRSKAFFLVTMHRAENVDREDKLRSLVAALERLHADYGHPVVCSLHPRTAAKMRKFAVASTGDGIRFLSPFGFFDFVRLEQEAFCVLSDSGTVQEETCILGIPNVTIREVTERPETIECGSNLLVGTDPDAIIAGVRLVTARGANWRPPPEYIEPRVAETVLRILTGYRVPDPAETEWRQGVRI